MEEGTFYQLEVFSMAGHLLGAVGKQGERVENGGESWLLEVSGETLMVPEPPHDSHLGSW